MFQFVQNKRIKIILLIVLILFFLIIVRVFYVQVIEYKKLNSLADDLWSRNLPVGANRGNIYDRNGKLIAGNITTVSLVLVPSQITNKEEVTMSLSKILNVSYEEMFKHVSKQTSIERVHPEGRNLNFEIADKINELNYDGVYLLKESKRLYKYDGLLSHVIGYVGIDSQGLSGIELLYDETLTGEDGAIKYYSDGKGKKLEMSEVYVSPKAGKDVSLTIDLDIQISLENELSDAMKKYDATGAIGIVMNPKSGEIYAMSSYPTFSQSNYKKYSIETINRNLAIWSNFEPGSTFKIVTLTAAINEKIVNIFEDKYYDTGKIKVAGSTIHCWKLNGHGSQTFLQVMENSCNPGFVVLANKLGKERLFKYIDELGFGNKTGIDLNGEGTGIIFDLNKVGSLELATTGFGQGVSVTALQQVNAVSAIVNNGTMYEPYIVKSYNNITNNPVIKKENIITEETSKLVRYALESGVAKGGGKNAYLEGYRVGGKTGTAQKVGANGKYLVGDYILSFIGVMPSNDPNVVIYIAVDGARNTTQYGSVVSAPIARNVLKTTAEVLDIKSDYSGLPKTYYWFEQKYIDVPNVVGLTKKDALKKLSSFTVEYSGKGEKVVSQSPESNIKVKEYSVVRLLLN